MDKKIMIPILAATLMLTCAVPGWAKSAKSAKPLNTFSVNLTSGDAEVGAVDGDLSQFSMALTVPLNNKVEFNGEFATGDIDFSSENVDTTSLRLKGDYRIFEDRTVRLDVAGGYYQRSLDLDDYSVSSFFAGLDSRIKLTPKLWVYGGLALGLINDEEAGHESGNPDSLYLLHLKFNYLINPRLGVSAGYFNESFDSELLNDNHSYNGLTFGAFFRF